MVACCCWPPGAGRDQRITARLQTAGDWQRVTELASRHRVIGLVYDGLRRFPQSVPGGVLQALGSAAARQMRGSLQLAAEGYRIVGGLQEAGIEVAVLKGAPLTMLAFGDLGLRHSRDNDLLVAPAKVAESAALIEAAGYVRTEPAANWGPEELADWRRHRKHFEYFSAERNTWLELHWRLTDNSELTAGAPALDNVVQVPVAPGIALPSLPVQDLLPYLILHGATHGWFRLKWLADVGSLLAAVSRSDRAHLVEQARAQGLDRPTLQAFELCRVLFHLELPEAPRPGLISRWLVRLALAAIAAEEPAGSVRASLRLVLQRYLLRPSLAYRRAQLKLDTSPRTDPLAIRSGWRYPATRLQEWVRRRRWPRPGEAKR